MEFKRKKTKTSPNPGFDISKNHGMKFKFGRYLRQQGKNLLKLLKEKENIVRKSRKGRKNNSVSVFRLSGLF